MKFTLILSLLISSSAYANMTCKGAVRLSLGNADAITAGINDLPVTAQLALIWIERDQNNLGNIRAACRDVFDAKTEFCSQMPDILMARQPGIIWNVTGTDDEKAQVLSANQKLQEDVSILCL